MFTHVNTTLTYIPIHVYTHIHIHTFSHIHMHPYICTHVYIPSQLTHTHTYIHIPVQTFTYTQIDTHAFTCIHQRIICIHTWRHAKSQCIPIQACTCAQPRQHTHALLAHLLGAHCTFAEWTPSSENPHFAFSTHPLFLGNKSAWNVQLWGELGKQRRLPAQSMWPSGREGNAVQRAHSQFLVAVVCLPSRLREGLRPLAPLLG